jgi:hypothetical protein
MVGLIQERTVHLSKWALHRSGEACAASRQRQFARWLHNPKIDPWANFRPLAKAALTDWGGQRIYLALDSSSLWDRFTLVRIALIYRGRALPLSWVVLVSQSTMVGFADYRVILDRAAGLLPANCRVVFLADRGFVDQKLFCYVRDLGWSFRIRLKGSLWVYRASKPATKVSRLMPAKGQVLFLHKVWITDRFFGPVYLALAHVQTAQGYEEWAILSDEPTDLDTFDEYGLRFDLEENFLDDKSAGFQLESSEITDASALSRLGLILAATTFFLVSTGVAVVTLGLRHTVDTHWGRGLSYFQIGWRWLRFALAHARSLWSILWFDPVPDPFPVLASRRRAARPIASFSALRLEVG